MQERKIREISKELKYISQTDEATGIYNRRKAIDELENQVALSKRYGTVFSIALIDIDNFKMVNDNHGHITGDYVSEKLFRLSQNQSAGNRHFGPFGRRRIHFNNSPMRRSERI